MSRTQKDSIGLYQQEAKPSKKTTKTIHQQEDETSIPLKYEEDESSLAIHFSSDEIAADIMNTEFLGHNADYIPGKKHIHNALGISTQKRRGVLSLADELEVPARPSSLTIATGSPTLYSLNWASIILYATSSSECPKPYFEKLQLPSPPADGLQIALPVTMGYKYLSQRTGTVTKKFEFATSPIAIPYLTEGEDPDAAASSYVTATMNDNQSVYAIENINTVMASGGSLSGDEVSTINFYMKNPGDNEFDRRMYLAAIENLTCTAGNCFWITMSFYYGIPDEVAYIHIFATSGIGTILGGATTYLKLLVNGAYYSDTSMLSIAIKEVIDYAGALDEGASALDSTIVSALSGPYGHTIVTMGRSYDIAYNGKLYANSKTVTMQVNGAGTPEASIAYIPWSTAKGTALYYDYTINISYARYFHFKDRYDRYGSGSLSYINNAADNLGTYCSYTVVSSNSSGPLCGLWIGRLQIVKPTNTTGTIKLSMYCPHKWDTGVAGYYTQEITGSISFTDAPIPELSDAYVVSNTDVIAALASNEVFDPALYSDRFSTYCYAPLMTLGSAFEIKNIMQGNGKDFGSIADVDAANPRHVVTSSLGLLKPYEVDTVSDDMHNYVLFNSSNRTIWSRNITVVYRLSVNLYLTTVTITTGETSGSDTRNYFGILDISNLRHYTPLECPNLDSISFDGIIVLTQTDTKIAMLISSGSDRIYMKFNQVRNLKGSIYFPEPYRDQFYIQEEVISGETVVSDIQKNCSYNSSGVLTESSLITNMRIVEHDEMVASDRNTPFLMEEATKTIFSRISSTSYGDAKVLYGDGFDFVTQPISLPIFYPSYFYGIPGPDAVGNFPNPLTPSIPVLSYYINSIMLYNFYAHNPLPLECSKFFHACGCTQVNNDTLEYAAVPMKVSDLINIESSSMLGSVAEKVVSLNSIPICLLNGNVYASSKIMLHRSDSQVIASDVINIFTATNYLIVVKNSSTEIMSYQKDSWFQVRYAIDDVAIASPITIGEELLLICQGGIYAVNTGKLVSFDINAIRASIVVLDGEGYVAMIEYSADVDQRYNTSASEPYVVLPEPPAVPSEETNEDYYVPRLIGEVEFYKIEFNLAISKLDQTGIADSLSDVYIPSGGENCGFLQLVDEEVTPSANTVMISCGSIALSDTPTDAVEISSTPITLVNERGEYFIISRLLLFTSGSAACSLTIACNSVTQMASSADIVNTSPTTSLPCGYVTANLLTFSLGFSGCSSDFVLHRVLAIGKYEDNKQLVLGD